MITPEEIPALRQKAIELLATAQKIIEEIRRRNERFSYRTRARSNACWMLGQMRLDDAPAAHEF